MSSKPDVNQIREDFPLLKKREMIYLDSAATSQKPSCVLDAWREFYEINNANPLRGLYELGYDATRKYEEARETVRRFINAESAEEIIFTRNATEGLNLAAYSLGSILLEPGDEIVVSIMEHHSNLLPWQQAAKRYGAVLKFLECDASGRIREQDFEERLTKRTKIMAMTHISNVLGCENDLKKYAAACHKNGTVFVADGAQSVPHMPVDVQNLDVDFLAFSGHKMLAPMGIGVLYGKKKLLKKMPPFLYGGEMIDSVTREGAVFAELPHKFEAGTVNAGGAVALAEAIRYMDRIGFDWIMEREEKLTCLAMEELARIPHVHILGDEQPENHHGIVAFTIDGVHPHDTVAILDSEHIALRAGHHCAQPLLNYLGVNSSARASMMFYNTEEEIMELAKSIGTIRSRMGYGL